MVDSEMGRNETHIRPRFGSSAVSKMHCVIKQDITKFVLNLLNYLYLLSLARRCTKFSLYLEFELIGTRTHAFIIANCLQQ